jgi:hypothetical protein
MRCRLASLVITIVTGVTRDGAGCLRGGRAALSRDIPAASLNKSAVPASISERMFRS